MIRNENTDLESGESTAIEIDLDAGTISREVDGEVVEVRPLTPEEVDLWTPAPPVDPAPVLVVEARIEAAAAICDEPLTATTVAGLRSQVDGQLSRIAEALRGG